MKLKEFKTHHHNNFSTWFIPLIAPRNNRLQRYKSEELKESQSSVDVDEEDDSDESYNGEYPQLIVNHISDLQKISHDPKSFSQDDSKSRRNFKEEKEMLFKSYNPILFEKNGL